MVGQGSILDKIREARKYPLNKHCREVMHNHKIPVSRDTVGAPDLLAWALDEEEVEILPEYQEYLESLIRAMHSYPPKGVKMLVEKLPELAEDEKDIYQDLLLKETDPVRLAELLLEKVHSKLINDPIYNPAPRQQGMVD